LFTEWKPSPDTGRDADRGITTFTLVPALLLLWSLVHHYLGLEGDARLYAVQALASVHSNLLQDLYLRNTSQDSYTLFSSIYSRCIGLLGLRNAALALTVAFKVVFFSATWALARRLYQGAYVFWAVALLILVPGTYGAYGVFHYAEDWLTARSAAEALVVTSIAFFLHGRRLAGLLIACGAMLLHPLVALPGWLWLVCLSLPFRLSIAGAAAGTVLVLAIPSIASSEPSFSHFMVVMDPLWLEVVRERSQFLLLQCWRISDWSLNARPFLSLSLGVLAIDDALIRKVGATAILVGAAGLLVALIASLSSPVSILLQGQAWRWVWITSFTSVLLLVPTLRALWRAKTCGLIGVVLVVCGWSFSAVGGSICLALALSLWLVRDFVEDSIPNYLLDMRAYLSFLPLSAGEAIAFCNRANRGIALTLVTGTLLAASLYTLPRALHDATSIGSGGEIDAYSDWRRAIPPQANVWVAPTYNSAAFAWFTLERPSYLTVDQSSGVVFSRATALEVRRRSRVLLPLMDPDWRLLSNMTQTRRGGGNRPPSVRPLTRERLTKVCRDPQLGFVVATENIGYEPLRHTLAAGQQDWYLYDCRIVNKSPA
jgi:hypothetical protein